MKNKQLLYGLVFLLTLSSCVDKNSTTKNNDHLLDLQDRNQVTNYFVKSIPGKIINKDSVWLSLPEQDANAPGDLKLNISGANNYSILFSDAIQYDLRTKEFSPSLKNSTPYAIKQDERYWQSLNNDQSKIARQYLNELMCYE